MFKKIILVMFLCTGLAGYVSAEEDHAIHEELRALLQGIQKAVNEERYGDLAPYFHANMRVTTINQEVIAKPEEIKDYFNRWFGPGGFLKKVEMKLTADAVTELYANKTMGIVRGKGAEDYILSDKRKYAMQTRWTATVIKDSDGKWRILSLHIGTNFLDNPILAEAGSVAKYFGLGGLLVGLVLMFIIGKVRGKKG
ncbi:MAG: DUF4440 domain-containing protein [Gammaproteobacteria bacterium]|nr:DUF4440 domain-containing protein [Gammaproteobacteria bacterium]MDH5651957.1 DUF4440 domain-containing protein [Gammaproteobacteria bacterium]